MEEDFEDMDGMGSESMNNNKTPQKSSNNWLNSPDTNKAYQQNQHHTLQLEMLKAANDELSMKEEIARMDLEKEVLAHKETQLKLEMHGYVQGGVQNNAGNNENNGDATAAATAVAISSAVSAALASQSEAFQKEKADLERTFAEVKLEHDEALAAFQNDIDNQRTMYSRAIADHEDVLKVLDKEQTEKLAALNDEHKQSLINFEKNAERNIEILKNSLTVETSTGEAHRAANASKAESEEYRNKMALLTSEHSKIVAKLESDMRALEQESEKYKLEASKIKDASDISQTNQLKERYSQSRVTGDVNHFHHANIGLLDAAAFEVLKKNMENGLQKMYCDEVLGSFAQAIDEGEREATVVERLHDSVLVDDVQKHRFLLALSIRKECTTKRISATENIDTSNHEKDLNVSRASLSPAELNARQLTINPKKSYLHPAHRFQISPEHDDFESEGQEINGSALVTGSVDEAIQSADESSVPNLKRKVQKLKIALEARIQNEDRCVRMREL